MSVIAMLQLLRYFSRGWTLVISQLGTRPACPAALPKLLTSSSNRASSMVNLSCSMRSCCSASMSSACSCCSLALQSSSSDFEWLRISRSCFLQAEVNECSGECYNNLAKGSSVAEEKSAEATSEQRVANASSSSAATLVPGTKQTTVV
jgi:hypothetical protein